ncbi:MAG: UbiX family flavin prenyltransferase [Candidatus Riflebacteria bacterium]|nr:UbiX family flavin prenyltransferase [Candidatus Riflebacteria bacterium]
MAKRSLKCDAAERAGKPGDRVVLGITGASGAIFADHFAKRHSGEKYIIPTRWGKQVFENELGKPIESLSLHVNKIYDEDDLFVPFASGSISFGALVILPCSVSTMAKIAHGISDNLLTRVAQVALKEKRKLIIGLRETPLSTIALRNAAILSESGAIIFPLCPAFYFKPTGVDDLVNSMIDRLCALLGEKQGRGFLAEELE